MLIVFLCNPISFCIRYFKVYFKKQANIKRRNRFRFLEPEEGARETVVELAFEIFWLRCHCTDWDLIRELLNWILFVSAEIMLNLWGGRSET